MTGESLTPGSHSRLWHRYCKRSKTGAGEGLGTRLGQGSVPLSCSPGPWRLEAYVVSFNSVPQVREGVSLYMSNKKRRRRVRDYQPLSTTEKMWQRTDNEHLLMLCADIYSSTLWLWHYNMVCSSNPLCCHKVAQTNKQTINKQHTSFSDANHCNVHMLIF